MPARIPLRVRISLGEFLASEIRSLVLCDLGFHYILRRMMLKERNGPESP
jgi:hypothetical protein